MTPAEATRSGLIAIVGRPNVGKSTLLNALVGEKISIVSSKPHTTRHRIVGILNRDGAQAVFVDTPGHAQRSKRALHRLMARVIHQSVDDCDLALLVVEAKRLTAEDRQLLELFRGRPEKTIVVLNKIDELKSKVSLLPRLAELQAEPFLAFVPVSAKSGENLDALVTTIIENLPVGPPFYPPEIATDRDLAFRAAEIIREKLLAVLHEEVPYGLTVEVEKLERDAEGRWLVHGLIWLERESHKPIVIGKQGRLLKEIGREARLELKGLLAGRVHLELWVKVREHWSDSERELKRLGFDTL